MKFLISALFAALSFAAPAHSITLAEADRDSLEALKAANDAAWNMRDVATIATHYVEEASVRVAPAMELLKGRATIERFFAESFGRRQGEFRHVTTLAYLEPLDETSVLSEGDVRVERREADGRWSLVRRFRTITIAVKDRETWKLRSVRAIPLS